MHITRFKYSPSLYILQVEIYSPGLNSAVLCDLYFYPVHILNKCDGDNNNSNNDNNNNNNNNIDNTNNNQVMVKPLTHM